MMRAKPPGEEGGVPGRQQNEEDQGGVATVKDGLLSGLSKWAQEVRKGPGAAVLAAGLLVIVVAFVGQIGPIRIVARAGSAPTAVFGLAMCAAGIWLTLRTANAIKGDFDPVVLDPAFMIRVFQEGMPPAFIKRVPDDGQIPESGLEHILESAALIDVQDETRGLSSDDPRFKEIRADHIVGDRAAVNERRSASLELATFLAIDDEIPILTFKTRIEHKGARYIVGWYIPIDLDSWPTDDRINLKKKVGALPKFRLAIEGSKEERCLVRVGEAFKSKSS